MLHGFSGNPSSMRGLATRLAEAGLTVELPRLPGHGTAFEDLLETRWLDWSAAADDAYAELARRVNQVVVVGLSMGGTLACWLAERHPEVAGLVAINPFVQPSEDYRNVITSLLEAGMTSIEGIGSDIAKPDVVELSYDRTPLEPLRSLFDAADAVRAELSAIRCPVLLFSSREDHVVPPVNGDVVASSVSGPVERVFLERSYHVATLDYDREEVESKTVDFVLRVTSVPAGEPVAPKRRPDVR